MKKFLNWLKSPKSDFSLFVIVLILINLVGQRAFFRVDLTSVKSYSLSAVSRRTVKNLEQPLSVKVFFSEKLPAPYNTAEQYLKDLLVEYKNASNKNFSYEYFNMNKPESENLAREYNLKQIQIQEVKNNEVGIRSAYMGVVLVYSDRIEILDGLTYADGLEYKLTTAMSNMISTTDILAGLNGNINMTLYISPELGNFGINGFNQVERTVMSACSTVNNRNMDRISYAKIEPEEAEIDSLVERYGIQALNWTKKNGDKGKGVLGLVLEFGDSFRLVPLEMVRGLFGWSVSGLENIEQEITSSLTSLVSKSVEIGYVTGHEELSLTEADQNGINCMLQPLASDSYTFRNLNLADETIPAGINTIIINGPKSEFSDAELYKIDQFLMKGGNVMFFVDPFKVFSMQNQGFYAAPQYFENEQNLDRLLSKYGVETPHNYVYDKNCFERMQQGYGKLSYYWAPFVSDKNVSRKHPVTRNLGNMFFLQGGSLDVSAAEADKNIKTTVLIKSSPESWTESTDISLDPTRIVPPAASAMKSENLAVVLEGLFESAFDEAPAEDTNADDTLGSSRHLKKSLLPGKVFVASSSCITTNQVVSDQGGDPAAVFIRNAVDYMNGAEELCAMRSKGLSARSLTVRNPLGAKIWQIVNEFGLTAIAFLLGLLVWVLRNLRRKRIRLQYNPDDSREIENIEKAEKSDKEGN